VITLAQIKRACGT